MAGTVEGAQKAKQKIIERYGEDFWSKQGKKGGKRGTTGGFASNIVGRDGLTGRERSRVAGKKGGKLSKRGDGKDSTSR